MVQKLTRSDVERELSNYGFVLLDEDYFSNQSNLLLMCGLGHKFKMTLNNWRRRHNCPECFAKNKIKSNFSNMVEEAEKNGFKVVTNDGKLSEVLTFECRCGHQFRKKFYFLKADGFRCPECAQIRGYWTEERIKSTIELENYRVIKITYRNKVNSSVLVECPVGHRSTIKFGSWLKGLRCARCGGVMKGLTNLDIKEHVESFGYTLLGCDYKTQNSKMQVRCPEGHEYEVTWVNWYHNKRRCRKCFGTTSLTIKEIEKIVKDEGFMLLSKEYKNAKTPLELKCPKGHTTAIQWQVWQTGVRCVKCGKGTSQFEKRFLSDLTTLCSSESDIDFHNRNIIKPKEIDFVVKSCNLGIELHGLAWHDSDKHDSSYHLGKLNKCHSAGYPLVQIFEDEYRNKKPIVLEKLRNYIQRGSLPSIEMTSENIKHLSFSEVTDFLNKNSIFLAMVTGHFIGAFHQTNLAAVVSYRPTRDFGIKINHITTRQDLFLNRFLDAIARFFFKGNLGIKYVSVLEDKRWYLINNYTYEGFKEHYHSFPEKTYFDRHKYPIQRYEDSHLKDRLGVPLSAIWDCGQIEFIKYNNKVMEK